MTKPQTIQYPDAVDTVFRMVLVLLVVVVAYVMWVVGFARIHEYVLTFGSAAVITLLSYGLSNYWLPLTKTESWFYVGLTNILLAGMVWWLHDASTLILITALSYLSIFISVLCSGLRLLRKL